MLDDDLRLLVAASAVTLSLGWPEYEWDQLTEVLLYADDFDRDYTVGEDEVSGLAHPWGTVILSVPSLLPELRVSPTTRYHVGIHEFAHILDVDHTHFDGVPIGLDGALERGVDRGRGEGDGAPAPPSPRLGLRRLRGPRPGGVPRGRGRGLLRDSPAGAPPPPGGLPRSCRPTSARTPRPGTTPAACASSSRRPGLPVRC